MPVYPSWIDILVTGFQYRAPLFIFTIVFLSVLLIGIFARLSAEWLRAWSSSNELLHPCYHRHAGDEFEGMGSSKSWKEDKYVS